MWCEQGYVDRAGCSVCNLLIEELGMVWARVH